MSRERAHLSLPPAGKLALFGAGLLMVAMVVLLVAQLAILADSREHIVAQDRKINRIVKGTGPVLDEAEPLAADARALVRDARPLLRATRPFVQDLRAEMVPLLRDLRRVDLRPAARLVDQGNELIDALRAGEAIPRTLRAADLVPELANILATTLRVQQDTLRTQRRAFRVNRQSRDIQTETLALLRRSLAIQEELLVHARSIDRKTGGTAPATGAPVPAAPR